MARGKRGGAKGAGVGGGEGRAREEGETSCWYFTCIFYFLVHFSFLRAERRRNLLLALPLNYCVKAKVPTCVQKKNVVFY